VKTWHWLIIAGMTLLTVVGQFVESYYWWEAVPGFFAAFGFAGTLLLIGVAKGLSKLLVTRSPDYYDKFRKDQEEKANVS
jgi:hypothetical protein